MVDVTDGLRASVVTSDGLINSWLIRKNKELIFDKMTLRWYPQGVGAVLKSSQEKVFGGGYTYCTFIAHLSRVVDICSECILPVITESST